MFGPQGRTNMVNSAMDQKRPRINSSDLYSSAMVRRMIIYIQISSLPITIFGTFCLSRSYLHLFASICALILYDVSTTMDSIVDSASTTKAPDSTVIAETVATSDSGN